jgi:hypothetical protein
MRLPAVLMLWRSREKVNNAVVTVENWAPDLEQYDVRGIETVDS